MQVSVALPVHAPQIDADPVDRDGCRVVKKKRSQSQQQPEAVPGAGGRGSGTDAWEGDGWMRRVGRAVEGVGWEGEADDLGTGEGGCSSRCFSHRILVLDNLKKGLEAR